MRSLVLLVATTAVVSGLRDIAPGFAADFRSFSESSMYQQRLPHRDQARSFREASQPSGLHQLQNLREESFRDYRHPHSGREETKNLFHESRGRFKEDTRVYKDGNRALEDELRNFNLDSRPFKDEIRIYKTDLRGFEEHPDQHRQVHDGLRNFRDERPFREEGRAYRNDLKPFREEFHQFEGPRNFRDEYRPFRDEVRHFRDERPFKEESGPFRNEPRPFRDERPFKEESGSFRNEQRPFRDEKPFKEESGPFRNEPRPFRDERPFKEESGPFRNEPRPFRDERPFKEESGPFRNEQRPFREESRPFKDELLFTEESRSLAEAQHRFNKEQQNRQPLSFGGHSNYLKFGNHGLGFASVPSAILPLQDNPSHRAAEIMMSTVTTPQSSEFTTSAGQSASSPRESVDSKNHNSVTMPPDVRSTPSQSTSSNTIDSNSANGQRNENPFDGRSTSSASTVATISTSGGTNATPKVVFGAGSASISSPSMGITSGVTGTGIQPTNIPLANSLHASKTTIHGLPNTYFSNGDSSEVPAALLNYIFKYQMPEKTKNEYTYSQSLSPESFNHIQSVPIVHQHQTAKYSILPEFKIPELSGIRQPGGTINYVSADQLSKVSYLNQNQPALTLGTSYTADNAPIGNYAQNLIQLGQGNQFSQYGQVDLQHIGQSQHFPQYRQIAPSGHVSQLGEYGQFGQAEQTRSPYGQGGLPLQLGGYLGIDYSALSSNSGASRGSPASGLEIGKVGLSLQEPARAPVSTFGKISFGQPLW